MKKNLLITATFGTAFAMAAVANAAPASFDLDRVIDGAIETIDLSKAQQTQKLDITKVNTVLTAAKDKVIVEFADFIASANASFNPATFNLDALTLDLSSDVTIKKSVWSQQPTTVAVDFGTKLLGEEGAQQLAAELGLSLRTQTLVLIKYGANLVLEENPVDEDGDSEEEAIARSYFTDVKDAANLDAVFARTLAVRDQILASTSEALAQAREAFAALTFTSKAGELSVAIQEVEFYGIKLSASVALNGAAASAKIKAVDVGNSLKEQIEEHKAEIEEFLLQIQNPTEEVISQIEDGFRGLFSGAKDIVGIKEIK